MVLPLHTTNEEETDKISKCVYQYPMIPGICHIYLLITVSWLVSTGCKVWNQLVSCQETLGGLYDLLEPAIKCD